ncbi:MAG: glycerol-3-phosphate 1-O-acyltransferase PlsY [Aestuariivirgaceae bacterium]
MAGDGSLAPTLAIFWLAVGYLSGSVPYGFLLAKFGGLGDVRAIGSGNIGATNVLRTGSKKIAFATLLCDMLKGALPVVLARYFAGDTAAAIAGFGAFIGHVIPVWLKVKCGKGVATYLGVLFAVAWPLAAIFIIVWLLLAAVFRYSSVSSLGGVAAVPLAAILLNTGAVLTLMVPVAMIVIYAHRGNIGRLIRGEESKITFKRSTSGA